MRSSQKMKILAIANASTCVGHRKYLRWAMKVLALKTVSTCVEKQKKSIQQKSINIKQKSYNINTKKTITLQTKEKP